MMKTVGYLSGFVLFILLILFGKLRQGIKNKNFRKIEMKIASKQSNDSKIFQPPVKQKDYMVFLEYNSNGTPIALIKFQVGRKT